MRNDGSPADMDIGALKRKRGRKGRKGCMPKVCTKQKAQAKKGNGEGCKGTRGQGQGIKDIQTDEEVLFVVTRASGIERGSVGSDR